MRAEEIDELLRRRPFAPFRIHLSDGSHYEVKHPEMAVISRYSMVVAIPRREGSVIASKLVNIALLHIVKTEELNEAKQPNV